MLDVSNIVEGEILCHPLCLLRLVGVEKNADVHIISFCNGSRWDTVQHTEESFINVIIMLGEGVNTISLSSNSKVVTRKVQYIPHTHDYHVRLIYVTCWDEEDFQGPSDMKKDVNEAVRRIQVGSLLLQTYLAETLSGENFGRRTFQLEKQENGYPKVFTLQLSITLREANSLGEEKLWQKIALEILSSSLSSPKCKYLSFYSGTRFSNPEKKLLESEKDILEFTNGHISLGGGGLAVVGTGALYAWASTLEQVMECMRCEDKVDSNNLMDFSGGRGTWGATYGTHLGSVLHELGHTFDLGHNSDGIMSRGFEDFHLFFCTQQLCNDYMLKNINARSNVVPNASRKETIHFTPDFEQVTQQNMEMNVAPSTQQQISSSKLHDCKTPSKKTPPIFEKFKSSRLQKTKPKMPAQLPAVPSSNLCRSFEQRFSCRAFWARSNAVLLAYHRWMTGATGTDIPVLTGSVVSSGNKIRHIELRDTSMTYIHHWEYVGFQPPAIVHLPWTQVKQWPDHEQLEVLVLDDQGNILKTCIPKPL